MALLLKLDKMSFRKRPLTTKDGILVPAHGNHTPRQKVNKIIKNKINNDTNNESSRTSGQIHKKPILGIPETENSIKKTDLVEDRIFDIGEDNEEELSILHTDDRPEDLSSGGMGEVLDRTEAPDASSRGETPLPVQEVELSLDGNSLPVCAVPDRTSSRKGSARKAGKTSRASNKSKTSRSKSRKVKDRREE